MGSSWWGFGAAFLGSAVESGEALTIVLAVGVTRGWRAPLQGGAAGLALLAALVLTLGQLLTTLVSDAVLKSVIGCLVLLASLGTFWAGEGFGVGWPLDAVSVLPLLALYLGASRLSIALLRTPVRDLTASEAA